jgi:hypothetical protein
MSNFLGFFMSKYDEGFKLTTSLSVACAACAINEIYAYLESAANGIDFSARSNLLEEISCIPIQYPLTLLHR